MELRIWKGKKGKYNMLALEALGNGEKTSWDIAKYIVEHDPALARGNWYHQTQKVHSLLLRRGGKLEELTAKEFITRREDGKKYSLTLLGFMYVLYMIEHAGWKLDRDKLFINYWPFLTIKIVEENERNFAQYSPVEKMASLGLAEVFRVYPDKPPAWIQTLWEEMSKSTMRRLMEYLALGKNLEDIPQREINTWVLDGVYKAYMKSFKMQLTQESKQFVSMMGDSFQKLEEEDKLMVIQQFKTMVHNAIYRTVRKNRALKKSFIEKVRQAEAHQIVCHIECPNCHYHGFSLQDGFRLLSSNFLITCEKCKKQSTHGPKTP